LLGKQSGKKEMNEMASEKNPQVKDSIKSGGDSTSTGIIAATRSNDPKSGDALAESLEREEQGESAWE
jgi:hypothetical protein